MSPSEFWRLTYAELRLVLEGCGQRRTREMSFQRNLQAWAAAIVIQPHVKESITPAMLLGQKERKKAPVKTPEQSLDEALASAKQRGLIAKIPSVNLFNRATRISNGRQ